MPRTPFQEIRDEAVLDEVDRVLERTWHPITAEGHLDPATFAVDHDEVIRSQVHFARNILNRYPDVSGSVFERPDFLRVAAVMVICVELLDHRDGKNQPGDTVPEQQPEQQPLSVEGQSVLRDAQERAAAQGSTPTPTETKQPSARIWVDRDGTLYVQSPEQPQWLRLVPSAYITPGYQVPTLGIPVEFERIELQYGPLRELAPAPSARPISDAFDRQTLLEHDRRMRESADLDADPDADPVAEMLPGWDSIPKDLPPSAQISMKMRQLMCGNGPDLKTGGLLRRGITAQEFDDAVEKVRTNHGERTSPRWIVGGIIAAQIAKVRDELFPAPRPESVLPTEPGLYLDQDGRVWSLTEKAWLRLSDSNGERVESGVARLTPSPQQAAPFTRLVPEAPEHNDDDPEARA